MDNFKLILKWGAYGRILPEIEFLGHFGGSDENTISIISRFGWHGRESPLPLKNIIDKKE